MSQIYPKHVESAGRLMRPEHFIGLLHGLILIEMQQDEPSPERLTTLFNMRANHISSQLDADEPTGLPIAPVWWTDEDPTPFEDEHEAIGMVPIMMPFLLCCSVEPYARWAVCPHSEERSPSFFPTRRAAEAYCEMAREAGREQRADTIEEAWFAVSSGDDVRLFRARQACQDLNIDFARDHATGLYTIDGQTGPLADGDTTDKAPGDLMEMPEHEQIIEHLGCDNPRAAQGVANQYGLYCAFYGQVFEFDDRLFRRIDGKWIEDTHPRTQEHPLTSEEAFHPHPSGDGNWMA